jgi:hypothetical protein
MISIDNLLGAFSLPFEHGLLVLEDADARDDHQNWNASVEKVHLDGNSLYVEVQASEDGPVEVEVYSSRLADEDVKEMVVQFSGEIAVPSGRLQVSDSDNTIVFALPVPSKQVGILILVDDDRWPARVMVILGDGES